MISIELLYKAISELRRQREEIDGAIALFERAAEGKGRKRGRPPKWITEARERAEENSH